MNATQSPPARESAPWPCRDRHRIEPRAQLAIAALLAASISASNGSAQQRFPIPLAPDSSFTVQILPAQYPQEWAFVALANDKIELRDTSGRGNDVKGQLPSFDSATLLVGRRRPEIYVADTVWERGNRGARTDFITVYDKQTFAPIGDIVLPGAKRALVEPMQGMFAFTDDERLALVFNFTPATSVTVVDLERRQVLNEIPIPACSLVYPTGSRGFSTLCAGGTLLTLQLDSRGAAANRSESEPFNPLESDPLFTCSALVRGVNFFPSLHGRVQPVDLRQDKPTILPDWPLVSPADAGEHWRPSGQQLIAGDNDGHLYVLMQPGGHEGTHKDPAPEVWAYDVDTRKRLRRIELQRPGVSIEITKGPEPFLLVATGKRLDVYRLSDGRFLRSLEAEVGGSGILIEAAN